MVGLQNADIADILHLRDIAMATTFVFLYMRCTLAPPGKFDCTVCVRQQCGLMSSYFDHLFCFVVPCDRYSCLSVSFSAC